MDSIRALLRDTIDGAIRGGYDGLGGLRVVRQHPKLLLWGLLPATLQILWLVCAFWFAFTWLPERLELIWSAPIRSFDALYSSVRSLMSLVVFLVALLLGLVVSQVLLAPVLHLLGRSIQRHLGEEQVPTVSASETLGAWRRSVASIALWFLGQLALLPLQVIPIFGGMAEATAGFAGSSMVMTREFMDVALFDRGLTLTQQFQLLWRHRFRVIALGGLGTVGLWTPVINILVFPSLSAAAILMARELLELETTTRDGNKTNDAQMTAPD